MHLFLVTAPGLPTEHLHADTHEDAARRHLRRYHPQCARAEEYDLSIRMCPAQASALLTLDVIGADADSDSDDILNGEYNIDGEITAYHAFDLRRNGAPITALTVTRLPADPLN